MNGAIFGLLVLLVGAIAGAAVGTDKTVGFTSHSDSANQVLLEDLRKKARIPDF